VIMYMHVCVRVFTCLAVHVGACACFCVRHVRASVCIWCVCTCCCVNRITSIARWDQHVFWQHAKMERPKYMRFRRTLNLLVCKWLVDSQTSPTATDEKTSSACTACKQAGCSASLTIHTHTHTHTHTRTYRYTSILTSPCPI